MGNETSSLPVDLPEEFVTELLDSRQRVKEEGSKLTEEEIIQKIIEEEIQNKIDQQQRLRRKRSPRRTNNKKTSESTTTTTNTTSSSTDSGGRRAGGGRHSQLPTFSRSATAEAAPSSSRIGTKSAPPKRMTRSLTTDSSTSGRIKIGRKEEGSEYDNDPQKVIQLLERYSVMDKDLADNFLKSLRNKKPSAVDVQKNNHKNDGDDQ